MSPLASLELLDILEVNAIPGVRQANVNFPLPQPDFDLSIAVPKNQCRTSHQYWFRGTIVKWLQRTKFLNGPKKFRIKKIPKAG